MEADNRFERVRAAVEQLGPADHACTLYDQRDEEVAIAASYIRAGLERSARIPIPRATSPQEFVARDWDDPPDDDRGGRGVVREGGR